jgi:hypothetical protein
LRCDTWISSSNVEKSPKNLQSGQTDGQTPVRTERHTGKGLITRRAPLWHKTLLNFIFWCGLICVVKFPTNGYCDLNFSTWRTKYFYLFWRAYVPSLTVESLCILPTKFSYYLILQLWPWKTIDISLIMVIKCSKLWDLGAYDPTKLYRDLDLEKQVFSFHHDDQYSSKSHVSYYLLSQTIEWVILRILHLEARHKNNIMHCTANTKIGVSQVWILNNSKELSSWNHKGVPKSTTSKTMTPKSRLITLGDHSIRLIKGKIYRCQTQLLFTFHPVT